METRGRSFAFGYLAVEEDPDERQSGFGGGRRLDVTPARNAKRRSVHVEQVGPFDDPSDQHQPRLSPRMPSGFGGAAGPHAVVLGEAVWRFEVGSFAGGVDGEDPARAFDLECPDVGGGGAGRGRHRRVGRCGLCGGPIGSRRGFCRFLGRAAGPRGASRPRGSSGRGGPRSPSPGPRSAVAVFVVCGEEFGRWFGGEAGGPFGEGSSHTAGRQGGAFGASARRRGRRGGSLSPGSTPGGPTVAGRPAWGWGGRPRSRPPRGSGATMRGAGPGKTRRPRAGVTCEPDVGRVRPQRWLGGWAGG